MKIEEAIQQKEFKSEFHKLAINLLYTANWLNENQNRLFKPYKLTGPQFNVLRILRGQYPNPATVNHMIERMIYRMSNASRIVDKLVQRGLVERKVCADDRRAVDILITKKGLDLLKEMDKMERDFKRRFSGINEEEAQELNRLLDNLRG